MKKLNPFIAAFALIAFITVGVFGMMAMTAHHHSPGCPFMPGEHVVCQMDVFDHISAWQHAFTAIVPVLMLVLFVGTIFLFVWHREWPPDTLVLLSVKPRRQRTNISDPYRELFARGILNPKIP